jgi:hypothetical protein
MTLRPLRTALVAAALTLLALPAGASAANSLEVGIADENVLKGIVDDKPVPGGTDAVVAQWKAAGVQDVRIFALWRDLAPAVDATKPPAGFVAKDPAAYDFAGLDQKIDAVVRGGLNVTLVVTGPGPVWTSSEPARKDGAYKPDPSKFGQFASAVAQHVGSRVNRYIVWNEPNQGAWLKPQYTCVGTTPTGRPTCTLVSPHLYRELARSGVSAIRKADSGSRVAIGGTSSRGNAFVTSTNTTSQPLTFLRTMGCVDAKYRKVRTGACKGFRPVSGDALAYHPHSLRLSPGQHDPDKNNARMGDLGRITTVLDKLQNRKALGVAHSRRMPLWLDEYGYETNPPDTTTDGTVPPKTAAAWAQWGWSVAARNPRVQTLTQYEWFDESTGDDGSQFNRWQSGLYTIDGKPKPLAAVFANPIFGWREGKRAYVWGQVRPGSSAVKVRVQRSNGSTFGAYRTVTTDRYGVFQLRVPVSPSQRYRFVYVDPSTNADVTSASTNLRKE